MKLSKLQTFAFHLADFLLAAIFFVPAVLVKLIRIGRRAYKRRHGLSMTALIVVDVELGFLPMWFSALGVWAGLGILWILQWLVLSLSFDYVVFTRDKHPKNHMSFVSQGGTWPEHCVDGTRETILPRRLMSWILGDLRVDKGTDAGHEAYSGFDGSNVDLAAWLRSVGVHLVYVVGIATDYCVKATALSAVANSFQTIVLSDAIAAVNVNTGDDERALEAMRANGAVTRDSSGLVPGFLKLA